MKKVGRKTHKRIVLYGNQATINHQNLNNLYGISIIIAHNDPEHFSDEKKHKKKPD